MQNVRSLPQFGAYTRRYFSDTTNGNIWHHPSGPYEHVKHIMKHNIKLRISEYSRHGQRRRTLFALYVFLIDSLLSRLLTSILLFLNKPHHLWHLLLHRGLNQDVTRQWILVHRKTLVAPFETICPIAAQLQLSPLPLITKNSSSFSPGTAITTTSDDRFWLPLQPDKYCLFLAPSMQFIGLERLEAERYHWTIEGDFPLLCESFGMKLATIGILRFLLVRAR